MLSIGPEQMSHMLPVQSVFWTQRYPVTHAIELSLASHRFLCHYGYARSPGRGIKEKEESIVLLLMFKAFKMKCVYKYSIQRCESICNQSIPIYLSILFENRNQSITTHVFSIDWWSIININRYNWYQSSSIIHFIDCIDSLGPVKRKQFTCMSYVSLLFYSVFHSTSIYVSIL